jgi:hypothetical protein
MYYKYIFLITLVFPFTNAEVQINRPPNPEPGKCYAKCLVRSEADTTEVAYPVYIGDQSKKAKIHKIKHVISPAKKKWVKKRSPGCRSTDPDDCLIWCLEELSPEHAIELLVVKKPEKMDPSQYEYQSFQQVQLAGEFTDWREVICQTKITKSLLRQLRQALYDHGYEVSLKKKPAFDSKLRSHLTDYQKSNGLPIGQLDLETLDSLGINY